MPAALAILACTLCVVAVVRGFGDARDAGLEASAAAPGVDQTLTITDTGGYTLAYSGPIIVRSTSEQEQLADALQLSIVPAGGGEALPLRPYDGLNDLQQDGQQYVPLLTVRFEQTGDYVLRSSSMADIDPERSALVVSESPYRKLRSGAERAAVILVVGVLLAILVTVILARLRGRSRDAIRAHAPPPQPVPWGAPPPGGWRDGPPPGGWSGGAPGGWGGSTPGGWGGGAPGGGAPGGWGGSTPVGGGPGGPSSGGWSGAPPGWPPR